MSFAHYSDCFRFIPSFPRTRESRRGGVDPRFRGDDDVWARVTIFCDTQ